MLKNLTRKRMMSDNSTYLLASDSDTDRRVSRGFSALRPVRLRGYEDVIEAARRSSTDDLWILLHAGQAADTIRAAATLSKRLGLLVMLDRVQVDAVMPLYASFRQVFFSPQKAFLPPEEMSEVLEAANKNELVIGGALDERSRTLTLYRGDGGLLIVPLTTFRPSGEGLRPNFDKFVVTDYGQTLKFGEYEASTAAVLYEFDADFRRRLREKRRQDERGFGPSLRRLRRQKGLGQGDFPPLSAKTIARIEQCEVEKPHGATLKTIEQRLETSAAEIETF
jgi:hypothetical protein